MSRIDMKFKNLKERNEKAFVPFLVIGDPNPKTFLKIIQAIEPIVDIIELGIPYSDPIADGPVIQNADKRAFSSGMNFKNAINLIKQIRESTKKPIVILTYANVIGVNHKMDERVALFSQAGIDGIIAADIPIEESENYVKTLSKFGIYPIFLAAPTTTDERLKEILKSAKGFLYIVAIKGVTGIRESVLNETSETIPRITQDIKKISEIPACVGFGISKPEHVKKIIDLGADGVIVGSAIIRILEENLKDSEELVKKIREYILKMKEQTKMVRNLKINE